MGALFQEESALVPLQVLHQKVKVVCPVRNGHHGNQFIFSQLKSGASAIKSRWSKITKQREVYLFFHTLMKDLQNMYVVYWKLWHVCWKQCSDLILSSNPLHHPLPIPQTFTVLIPYPNLQKIGQVCFSVMPHISRSINTVMQYKELSEYKVFSFPPHSIFAQFLKLSLCCSLTQVYCWRFHNFF